MGTLSNNQEKLIRSLKQKKFRDEHQLFVVEGEKLVKEAVNSDHKVLQIVSTKPFDIPQDDQVKFLQCDEHVMKGISSLKTAPGIMAIVAMKEQEEIDGNGLILALDRIQDPGNLGTIIRSADAFGLRYIICSQDTVDVYSSKVVQASMGSVFRVQIHYLDLALFIENQKTKRKIYASHLNGENVYDHPLDQSSVLIMGNESKGVAQELVNVADQLIKIPTPGKAESLNVSMATTVLLSEFGRRTS